MKTHVSLHRKRRFSAARLLWSGPLALRILFCKVAASFVQGRNMSLPRVVQTGPCLPQAAAKPQHAMEILFFCVLSGIWSLHSEGLAQLRSSNSDCDMCSHAGLAALLPNPRPFPVQGLHHPLPARLRPGLKNMHISSSSSR